QNDGDLSITNSTVSGNTAGQEGGGLFFSDYYTDGDMAVITGSVFEGNHAGNEGGGIYTRHSDLTLSNSTVSGNTADNEGGGLYFGSSYTNSGYPDYNDLPSTDYALITDSRFENNESFYNEGGAIYHDGGTMRIERSVISGNTADDQGGGIYAELGPLFLIDSTVSDNTSGNQGGGIYTDGPLSLSGTTVSGNTATTGNGGGIHVDDEGSVEIVNSTLSGNTAATGNGGGIHFNEVFSNNIYGVLSNTITHTTITDNTAGGVGGGVALDNNYDSSHSPAAVLVATIVSGNTATGAGDEIDDAPGNVTADAFNVLGDSGKNNADAFNNFTPGASDISATSDGTTPTAIGGILNPTLADNGGPTLTHLLVDGSPALDTAPDGPATDQRGAARPRGAAWDSGAVEGTTPLVDAVFMSTTLPGTTGDGLPFGMEDIIMWDGSAWSMWFDGSAAGLTPTGKWKHNINAFWIPDASADDVLISFTQNRRYVPGIVAPVNGMDLVWWDGSAFSLYFDGEDVGLNQMTQEKIDGLHVLPGSASPIGGSCLSYLLISTQGPGRITDYTGTSIRFGGEDVLGFCLTNAGDNTAGFWHMVLDGSAEGMPRNATDSISVSADGQTMYLTTQKTFNVDSASGGHSMVYAYDFGTGTFSGPYFSAPANGLNEKVDGLQVEGDLGN
ncbi:MAG TPA: choice-of-anchor Q domain-containing protein, partial [Promineifilum sp.]|nr:choice-of-anchor Q domain-containing protein [Promineifilum sp.]